MKTLFFLFVTVGFMASGSCTAQTFRIRVINAKNREPISNQSIMISWLYEKNPQGVAPKIVQLQTNSSGEAEVGLPSPVPDQVSVRATLRSDRWRCACMALVQSRELIKKGTVVVVPPDKGAEAKPGEVVFMAYPLSFFERLLYPLTKD